MKERLLRKDNIKNLCVSASHDWETYLPLEGLGGDVQFMKFDDKEEGISLDRLNLDYESLVIPPKVTAFPQLESLFEFKDGRIIETVKPQTRRLLFGLRACDVKGILFLDDFFRRNFEDIYYLKRSMDRLLVIVGCKRPLKNCFCTSTKTGPFLPVPDGPGRGEDAQFDLQLVDVGNSYVVDVGSEKGEEFIKDYRKFFDEATKGDIGRGKKAKREAEEAIELKLDFEKAIGRYCEDKVSEEIYKRIAERCIYCGGCLYVCPTCSCFNVIDDLGSGSGRRCRIWDACVFEGYTREASGHNPRPEKWIRTSRRYEHKLKYDYLVTGMSGCVGCGRCLSSCPVNIGMSQVIEEVSKD